MAHVHETKLSLRISGDALVPREITELLGAPPDFSHVKGEELVGKTTGRVRIASSGMWLLSVPDKSPEELDSQLTELLDRLTDDLAAWEYVNQHFSADLFCGLFLCDTNEGLTISQPTMKLIADRRLEIGFDIYGCESPASTRNAG